MDTKIATLGFLEFGTHGLLEVHRTTYADGAPAVVLLDAHGETVIKLSTNLVHSRGQLGQDEFFVKNWTENEECAKVALESGLFEDTGLRVDSGFVEVPVWRIKAIEKKAANDADMVQSACNPSGVVRSLLTMLQGGLGPSSPVAVMFASKIGDMAGQGDDTPSRYSTWEGVTQLATNAVQEMSTEIRNGTGTDGLRQLPSFQMFAKELRAWTRCTDSMVLSSAMDRIQDALNS